MAYYLIDNDFRHTYVITKFCCRLTQHHDILAMKLVVFVNYIRINNNLHLTRILDPLHLQNCDAFFSVSPHNSTPLNKPNFHLHTLQSPTHNTTQTPSPIIPNPPASASNNAYAGVEIIRLIFVFCRRGGCLFS